MGETRKGARTYRVRARPDDRRRADAILLSRRELLKAGGALGVGAIFRLPLCAR